MADQYTLDEREGAVRIRQAWDQALVRLAGELPRNQVTRFLKPLKPISLESGVARFEAPGAFVYEWVRDKFSATIARVLSDEIGSPVTFELKVAPRAKPVSDQAVVTVSKVPLSPETPRFKPTDRYRFDTYVVGQSNRLAFAGAKAVADDPGKRFNPLFIYGPSGLGKTHLLHAIAQQLLEQDPRCGIVYISAQQFAEEFVQALQSGKIDQFRRSQRSVGIWLVDDIQFIAGKDRTQEEIFHTFNYLHQIGKQIVLCSDRPPRDLFLMDERLRSRFEAGLVADIQPPDTELRCAILLSKAEQEGIHLDHEVALCLAESVPGNVRMLEGALTKLAAQASVTGQEIGLDLAQEIVEKYYQTRNLSKPGVNQILDAVSKYYKVPIEEILSLKRNAPITHARHVAVYLAREITGDSWKHIGSQFGGRDHTSMMHAHEKISKMIVKDKDLGSTVKMLTRNLYPQV